MLYKLAPLPIRGESLAALPLLRAFNAIVDRSMRAQRPAQRPRQQPPAARPIPRPSVRALRPIGERGERAARAGVSLIPGREAQAARRQAPASSGPGPRASLSGFRPIPSYSGKLPSPLPTHFYVPQGRTDLGFVTGAHVRGWVDDAARYQRLPTELPAAILQGENGPNATLKQQVFQAGERALTTAANLVDHLPGSPVPNKYAEGSTGIGNVRRPTLRRTKSYVEGTLGRPLVPDDVARRAFGVRLPAIAGLDTRNDVYHSAAHLRQLTDQITGVPDYVGPLTPEQVQRIAARYNGTNAGAQAHGRRAVNNLRSAASGEQPLYFYEPRPTKR